MGISAYRKKHCWNWAQPVVGDVEQISGVIFVYIFFQELALNFQKFLNYIFLVFLLYRV